jgi:hypothetical protein
MVYTKNTWTTSTRISAEALNHLETQYDEVKASEATWNDHTSRYYTKAQAITKFFNPSFMGSGSGADADLLDGHHVSDLIGTGLPVGAITWWSKSSGLVPSGWHVCDGASGTTDYRDRFVVGVSSTYTVKNFYGSATVTPTTYSVTIGGTALTTAEMPSHTHTWSEVHCMPNTNYNYTSYGGSNGTCYYYLSSQTAETTQTTGSGAAHTHEYSTVTWSSEANIPPYYAIYLIQRLS